MIVDAILFNVLWLVVAFVLLGIVLRMFFRETGRATFASAAIVLAFGAGAAWPFSNRIPLALQSQPKRVALPANVKAEPTMAAGDTQCSALRLSPLRPAIGNVDVLADMAGTNIKNEGGVPLVPGRTYVVTGWAGDSSKGPPSNAVCLMIDGKSVKTRSAVGYSRPDVAASLEVPGMVASGFEIRFSTLGLDSGPHRLKVASIGREGAPGILSGQWEIQVL